MGQGVGQDSMVVTGQREQHYSIIEIGQGVHQDDIGQQIGQDSMVKIGQGGGQDSTVEMGQGVGQVSMVEI